MHRVVGALLAAAVTWHVPPAWAEEEGRPAAVGSQEPAVSEAKRPATEAAQPAPRMRDRNAGARLGLIVGGSLALGAFYGAPCAGAGGLWCVPFAGPVLVVAKRERAESANDDDEGDGIVPPAFVYALAGSLGMLQLASAAVITVGALMPRREVPDTSRSITVLPMVSSSTAGVGVVGTW
jgi:hypothetical protein